MKRTPKRSSKSPRHHLENNLAALSQKLGPIEMRAIASLRKYARNPRQHPEHQIVALEASIGQFGFTIPVLVDEYGEIIAGEARIEAAKRAGLTEVPVLVAHHWSRSQVKAYRLADNRLAEHATWDINYLASEILEIMSVDEVPIEIVGWGTAEIDVILDEAKDLDISAADPADDAVEIPVAPTTQVSDLWLLGSHRLLCASSLEEASWERLMNGMAAAMAFNDPPFNVPVAGHVCGLGKVQHSEFAMASGEMSQAEFVKFLTAFLRLLANYCEDGAVIDVCMDWRHIAELHEAFGAANLTILNLCVWNKNNGGMGSLYRSKHELVFIAKKGKAPHRNNIELGKNGRYRTNVWDYAGVNGFGENRLKNLADHPTVKPVALVADAIRDVTSHGDIVVDAFLGSGTTLLASERTQRIAYGLEIEPRFVDVAIRRWETMTEQQAILESTGEMFCEVAARRSVDNSNEEDGDSEAA